MKQSWICCQFCLLLQQAASEKTNLFNQIMEMQGITLTNRTLLFLAHVSWLRCHMKGQENELSRNVIFSLKFIYRPPNDFLVPSSSNWFFNHSCVKYASYELHQMKEEDLSFTNMCHLLIMIVIKLWYNRDNSRFCFFWEALYIFISHHLLIHLHIHLLLLVNSIPSSIHLLYIPSLPSHLVCSFVLFSFVIHESVWMH